MEKEAVTQKSLLLFISTASIALFLFSPRFPHWTNYAIMVSNVFVPIAAANGY